MTDIRLANNIDSLPSSRATSHICSPVRDENTRRHPRTAAVRLAGECKPTRARRKSKNSSIEKMAAKCELDKRLPIINPGPEKRSKVKVSKGTGAKMDKKNVISCNNPDVSSRGSHYDWPEDCLSDQEISVGDEISQSNQVSREKSKYEIFNQTNRIEKLSRKNSVASHKTRMDKYTINNWVVSGELYFKEKTKGAIKITNFKVNNFPAAKNTINSIARTTDTLKTTSTNAVLSDDQDSTEDMKNNLANGSLYSQPGNKDSSYNKTRLALKSPPLYGLQRRPNHQTEIQQPVAVEGKNRSHSNLADFKPRLSLSSRHNAPIKIHEISSGFTHDEKNIFNNFNPKLETVNKTEQSYIRKSQEAKRRLRFSPETLSVPLVDFSAQARAVSLADTHRAFMTTRVARLRKSPAVIIWPSMMPDKESPVPDGKIELPDARQRWWSLAVGNIRVDQVYFGNPRFDPYHSSCGHQCRRCFFTEGISKVPHLLPRHPDSIIGTALLDID